MARSQTKYRNKISVRKAWFAKPLFGGKSKGGRGSQRAGLAFERNVGKMLRRQFDYLVWDNVWLGYETLDGEGICSPDFLLVDVKQGVITIVECKLTHTELAYWQMANLYFQVIKQLFPGFQIRCVEVCKNFDRSVSYPVKVQWLKTLDGRWSGRNAVHVVRR